MHIAPDQVCSIKHTYLKVRSDGTSSIKCCFQVQGTRLLSVMDEKDVQGGEMQLPPPKDKPAPQELSSTAAAVAAVFPAKVRLVIRSDQRNSKWKEQSLSACADDSSSGDVAQKPPEHWCDVHSLSGDSSLEDLLAGGLDEEVINHLSCQFEELSDLDSVAHTKQVKSAGTKPKRKRGAKKVSAADEWLSVAQDAHRSGSLAESADLATSAASGPAVATPDVALDWRPVHPPAHLAHISTTPRAPKLGCPMKRSTEQRLAARSNTASPLNDPATSGLAHADKLTYLVAENERALQECQLYSANCQGLVVLMSKLNTVCSFEMEFSAEGKVTSVVLNYIT